ncbi:MAG: hypothetical protein HYZ11_15000 [Candidatus Tectomicrobia bacterium]|uniref:YCII-related domain-containing protein n=1 Tax=Tectimicrobiota bacterium TaxID=2528274 RepID=A0A932I075_UNCTE|nr:hypothetical protein [Candidatus Tectomicrobia bacterium]
MMFSIKIYDKPGSQALRDAHRKAHLDYLKSFDEKTLFAGPFLAEDNATELGSMRLLDFPDRAAAERHVAEEPYILGGCQERPAIHRWRPGVPHTWRDCPRTEGNEQFYVFVLDKPGGTALRARIKDVNRRYMEGFARNVMVRGPLLSDEGRDEIGTTMLLDFPGMRAARAFLDGAPYSKEGLWGQVEFHRWRFGRVFDRLKVPAK